MYIGRPYRFIEGQLRLPGLLLSAIRQRSNMIKLMRGSIGLYRIFISPLLGKNCRFEPTCSHYASEALLRHGFWRGSHLAFKRLARCHPWGSSGFDPVP